MQPILRLDRRSFIRWLAVPPLLAASIASRAIGTTLSPSVVEQPPPDIALPSIDEDLKEWLSAPRTLILDSEDPKERYFIRAILLCQPVEFVYLGGTTPGSARRVHPVMLYRVWGFSGAYLTAFCQSRQEIRTFLLDRILPPLHE
jgi:hypothetical protein